MERLQSTSEGAAVPSMVCRLDQLFSMADKDIFLTVGVRSPPQSAHIAGGLVDSF